MTPEGRKYICHIGRKNRDQERRLEITFGKGDYVPVVDTEEEEPMAEGKDARKEFAELLKSVQDLSKRIEEMGQKLTTDPRQHETPRGFYTGEGSGKSHHLQEHLTAQQMASHTPPRSTMPTFLAADTRVRAQQEQEPPHIGDYFAEYQSYGQEFRDALTFHDSVQLKRDSRPLNHHRGNRHSHDGDMQRTVGRFYLSTFDGSAKSSAKAWVEKLDIYFQLNQMAETETIEVAALHLDGEAHDW